MAKPRKQSNDPKRHHQWRCPCGARLGLDVTRTEHDEDGLPIRVRVCRNCGEPMATEERPIPYSSFFARANTHQKRSQEAYARQIKTCRYCNEPYKARNYSRHVLTPKHLTALSTNPTAVSRRRERIRAQMRYWAERGFRHMTPDSISALQHHLLESRPTAEKAS